MARLCKNPGFSLTEVLLSVGTLAVGMIFIAGVFPVAIHFSTVATEQTIAAVVADEAFAKIRIYAIGDLDNSPTNDDYDPDEWSLEVKNGEALADFNNTDVFPATEDINSREFAYPSEPGIGISQKQYFWSALCRLTEGTLLDPNPPVQVTVFVCRRVSPHLVYRTPDGKDNSERPIPVIINVGYGNEKNELEIRESGKKTYINDGYTIVDDRTGRLYRVLKRYPPPDDEIILLDRDWNDEDWQGSTHDPEWIWVVPPPVNGGKNPCIAIYQKVIRF